jgi:nucleotide-binding universal stress UspA family protein
LETGRVSWKQPQQLFFEWNPAAATLPELPRVRTILYPFDLSPRALDFAPVVSAAADLFRGEVITMHVGHPNAAGRSGGEAALLRAKIGAARTRYITRTGNVVRAIAAVAMELADLVVLSTRGLGPIRRCWSTSVTLRLLEDLYRPVLLCGAGAMRFHPDRAGRVLCVLPAAGDRVRVLNWAVALATAGSADLAVIDPLTEATRMARSLPAGLIVTGRNTEPVRDLPTAFSPYDVARRATAPVLVL